MSFPDTERKIRQTISRYRNSIRKEQERDGCIGDGAGKRFMLFALYFVLDDREKSQEYLDWYENELPDCSGEPVQLLCWALILHRSGRNKEARRKLAGTMLSNLYLIPYALGQSGNVPKIHYSSNWEQPDYVHYTPRPVLAAINAEDRQWLSELYHSPDFLRLRNEYITLSNQLEKTKEIQERTMLVNKLYSLVESM